MPQQLMLILGQLRLNTSLCIWLLNSLTGRPQAVQVSSNTSSNITLNSGLPQECVLSPLLFTLLTDAQLHLLIKGEDETIVVGLISGKR